MNDGPALSPITVSTSTARRGYYLVGDKRTGKIVLSTSLLNKARWLIALSPRRDLVLLPSLYRARKWQAQWQLRHGLSAGGRGDDA